MRHAIRTRLARGRDQGMTITEMAVVMLILGIIVAATATLAIGFTRTNAENISRQDQIDTARSTVERLTATIRTAVKPSLLAAGCSEACDAVDAFMQGKDLSMQFYANLDNPGNATGPSRVTYTVGVSGADAGVLVEKVQTADDQNPATPTVDPGPDGYVYCNPDAGVPSQACLNHLSTRRLAEGVLTDGSHGPVFRYFGPGGVRLSPNATTGLSTDDLARVLTIEIDLTVQSTNVTKAEPTTYIQRVTLPNSLAVLPQGTETPTP